METQGRSGRAATRYRDEKHSSNRQANLESHLHSMEGSENLEERERAMSIAVPPPWVLQYSTGWTGIRWSSTKEPPDDLAQGGMIGAVFLLPFDRQRGGGK